MLLCSICLFPGAQKVKNRPAVCDTQVQSLGWEDPLKKRMAIPSSILAWKTPWTEEPAADKSFQSCPTLCDPIDGSPPGSPIPGILKARTLKWGAIALSKRNLMGYNPLGHKSQTQLSN